MIELVTNTNGRAITPRGPDGGGAKASPRPSTRKPYHVCDGVCKPRAFPCRTIAAYHAHCESCGHVGGVALLTNGRTEEETDRASIEYFFDEIIREKTS